MESNFIDFEELFDIYLNRPIKETLRYYRFPAPLPENDDKIVIDGEYIKKQETMDKLQNLLYSVGHKPKVDFYSFYILGINEDGLKFAQYSTNYLFDELINIKSFIDGEHKNFYKNLNYLYFIDEKHKFKYVEKAKRKNKETIYFNDKLGSQILDYIDGQKKELLGDKYGVQNCILDNITNEDNLRKKFIVILSFDVDLFEIYYSIPFEMNEKGSDALEKDLVYCCRLDEIEPNKILKYLDENANNYI